MEIIKKNLPTYITLFDRISLTFSHTVGFGARGFMVGILVCGWWMACMNTYYHKFTNKFLMRLLVLVSIWCCLPA